MVLLRRSGQRLTDLDLWNQGPGPAVFGEGVRDLTIEDSRIRASGGLELLGDRMDVARNRIEDGHVGLREGLDKIGRASWWERVCQYVSLLVAAVPIYIIITTSTFSTNFITS